MNRVMEVTPVAFLAIIEREPELFGQSHQLFGISLFACLVGEGPPVSVFGVYCHSGQTTPDLKMNLSNATHFS